MIMDNIVLTTQISSLCKKLIKKETNVHMTSDDECYAGDICKNSPETVRNQKG